MAIVTISFEMGAGGPDIGEALAERLSYRYVDREIVSEAAHRFGCLEEKLQQLDETKPSFFERFDADTRMYWAFLQSSMLDFAEEDNVVLMGRAGQVHMARVAHALRIRIMAPFAVRVRRIVEKMAEKMGEAVDPRTVTEMVRRNDAEKSGRMRYLHEVDWADPALYDLVLNTEKLPLDACVDVVATLIRRLIPTLESKQLVSDRALAMRVRAALAANHDTRKYRIGVAASQGVVTIEGTGVLDLATEVARGVRGVVDVKVQTMEIPPIPPFVA